MRERAGVRVAPPLSPIINPIAAPAPYQCGVHSFDGHPMTHFDLRRAPARPLLAGLLLACSLVLAGCERPSSSADTAEATAEYAEMPAPAPMAESAKMAAPMAPMALQRAGGAASFAAGVSADAADPAAQRHIAVRHMLTVESPGDQLPALWEKVRAQCEALRCELLNSSLRQETPRQGAGASLSLRVAPEDTPKLLGALQGAGTVVQHDTHSEDLSAQVIDVEAHIRNRTEFRDSLRALLARSENHRALKDVLDIQRTLTQTQAELDSRATQLKALQARTRMQQIDIDFRAEHRVVSGGGSNPIARAWEEAGETLAYSAAAVVTFVAMVLPWVPLALLGLGLLLWLWLWLWRRRRARRAG